MKKRNLKNLKVNKTMISNLKQKKIVGRGATVDPTCFLTLCCTIDKH